MLDSFALLRAIDGACDDDIMNAGAEYISAAPKRRAFGKRMAALALAAVLIMALGTAAYAALRRAAVLDSTIGIDSEQLPAVGFESTDDEAFFMGVWEMGELPAGFVQTKSYYRADEARTDYQNSDGDIISLIYEKPKNYLDSYFSAEVLSKENVTVNGNSGVYYVVDNGWKYVYWTIEERGVGMRLCVKGDYDALALAAAVHETDNYPPIDEETTRALAELGDWRIAAPQGYAEHVTYGTAGEFGYITRVYADAGHNEIKLDYEQSVTDLAGYVDYYRTPDAGYGEISFTELSVDGNVAWLLEKPDGTPFRLTWQEAEHGLTFTLAANKLTSDELIKAAQGIRLYN